MSLTSKLLSASGGVDKLYSDSVFSAYTYTGNGATQTINNGIDLAGKGGLVWIKQRTAAADHQLNDTARGATYNLTSNTTSGQSQYTTGLTAFNADGFSLGTNTQYNNSAQTFVSWTFRKAPKFFDVVTYTGNGVAGRQIPHDLGVAPGMMIGKSTSAVGQWFVYHRSISPINQNNITLNTTSPTSDGGQDLWGNGATVVIPTDSVFTVGISQNTNGVTYVAYLFAHDPSADSIIKCGSFNMDGSGNATVDLGWEPQYVMVKAISQVGDWTVMDQSRGFNVSGFKGLVPNISAAEYNSTSILCNGRGFEFVAFPANSQWIYIAIRRSNKPPTLGTQVYNAIARTGTGAAATVTGVGFAPDLALIKNRFGYSENINGSYNFFDRLRGGGIKLATASTDSEVSTSYISSMDMDGITFASTAYVATNDTGNSYINHFFKRAVGVFDEVCYTGIGGLQNIPHGLGVVPELIIVKRRSSAATWATWVNTLSYDQSLELNSTASKTDIFSVGFWNSKFAISSEFYVGSNVNTNASAATFVAYLFASKAGISKVFSYTGNGSSQTIDCGFTTGARFVMIKRTDAVGDWLVADSTRGIIDASDPRLSLNTTAAEVTTDDWLDTNVLGFVVNQTTASNANVSGATYIGLSFA
jgi:Tfp pilus assembly protein FimT